MPRQSTFAYAARVGWRLRAGACGSTTLYAAIPAMTRPDAINAVASITSARRGRLLLDFIGQEVCRLGMHRVTANPTPISVNAISSEYRMLIPGP